VSVPLAWSELSKKSLRPNGITIRTIFGRLEKAEDPWHDFWDNPASLATARRKLARRAKP
jgi:DNA primase